VPERPALLPATTTEACPKRSFAGNNLNAGPNSLPPLTTGPSSSSLHGSASRCADNVRHPRVRLVPRGMSSSGQSIEKPVDLELSAGRSSQVRIPLVRFSALVERSIGRYVVPGHGRDVGQKRRSRSSAGPVQHGNAPEPATTARSLWSTVCGRYRPEAHDPCKKPAAPARSTRRHQAARRHKKHPEGSRIPRRIRAPPRSPCVLIGGLDRVRRPNRSSTAIGIRFVDGGDRQNHIPGSGSDGYVASMPSMPHLKTTATGMQLIVDGEPTLLLGGQLHNSSPSSAEDMQPVWDRLAAMHVGTVIGRASWELTEPEEGHFDFLLGVGPGGRPVGW
jgi:hypothetical protein